MFNDIIAHPDRTLPFHDLVYVISGGFNVIVENELVESREGDIMFLPAYKHHYPAKDNLKNSSCYFIHFSHDAEDCIDFFKPNNIKDESYCIPSKLSVKDNPRLIHYFHELATLASMDPTENRKLINSILASILSEIDMQVYKRDKFKYSELTNSIISILIGGINSKISIDDLSQSLNFAPRTIQKHFKNDTGKSIHEYHIELKLNESKYFLIAYPDMKLKEIAFRFGFYDEFHYSKSFKKLFNISPSSFRERNT